MSLHIALFEPEKPLNTGNIGRTCVLTNTVLHIIKPFQFSLDEKEVRRAGLDYWKNVDVRVYENFYEFYDKFKENNIYICSTKAKKYYTDVVYKDSDVLLFGKESRGLPEYVTNLIKCEFKIKIPMIETTTRSLNVANSANIILYEALRQLGFPNMK